MSILEEYYKYENISKERELELFKDINNEENKEELVKSHLKLVAKIAKKYSFLNPSMFEDLIQDGTLGMVLAIDRFDPSLGFRFSTFASFYIRNQMRQSLRKSAFLFHIPSTKTHQLFKLINEMRKAKELDDSVMSLTEISEVMDCSLSQARELTSILLCKERYCQESSKAIDVEKLDEKLKIIEVTEALSYFNEKDRNIVKLRYNHGKSWRSIGSHVGMSHEGCRKRHDRIIELIKSHLTSLDETPEKSQKHNLCTVQ